MDFDISGRTGFFRHRPVFPMKLPIALLLILFGAVPMLLGTQTVLLSVRQNLVDGRMAQVQNQGQILSSKIARQGYLAGEDKSGLISEIETLAGVYDGRFVVIGPDFRIVQDTYGLAENKFHVAEEVIRTFAGESTSRYYSDLYYYVQTFPIYTAGEEKTVQGVLLFIGSTETLLKAVSEAAGKTLLFVVIVLLLLVIFAVLLSIFLLRPFRAFADKLHRVNQGDWDVDLTEETYTELRDISGTVEQTFTRLRDADRSRQEFVSNVSHELKTPITSIRVLADSLMSMGDTPPELYREFMEDISDEIDRESKIIDDLLTLVRTDRSEADMTVAQVNINQLAEQILKRLRPIANKQKVELIFESIRDVTAEVDEVKLSLAITNLVENAVKYNREDGFVRLTLDADHRFFYIKVADSGIGIPEDVQTKIFDRFYRVDKARSRETGGTGLGLSITRSVVLMHRGAIKVSSREGEGSVFTVRIPLTHIGQGGGA